MRWLGAVVIGIALYVGVPLLWQRAMIHEVNRIAAEPSPIPVGKPFPAMDAILTINAINPPITINTEEYERIAVQSQVDQQMRQVQAAQDQAWRATHP